MGMESPASQQENSNEQISAERLSVAIEKANNLMQQARTELSEAFADTAEFTQSEQGSESYKETHKKGLDIYNHLLEQPDKKW